MKMRINGRIASSFIVALLSAVTAICAAYYWIKAGMPFEFNDYRPSKSRDIPYVGLIVMFVSIFLVAFTDFFLHYSDEK